MFNACLPIIQQGNFPANRKLAGRGETSVANQPHYRRCAYLALALHKQRTLLTVLDCGSLERLRGLRRMVLLWVWYVLPIRRAGLVSVISESTRRELLRHVKCDPSKIRVVPCCVGSDFAPVPKSFRSEEHTSELQSRQ